MGVITASNKSNNPVLWSLFLLWAIAHDQAVAGDGHCRASWSTARAVPTSHCGCKHMAEESVATKNKEKGERRSMLIFSI